MGSGVQGMNGWVAVEARQDKGGRGGGTLGHWGGRGWGWGGARGVMKDGGQAAEGAGVWSVQDQNLRNVLGLVTSKGVGKGVEQGRRAESEGGSVCTTLKGR